jgi:hypothetical protein
MLQVFPWRPSFTDIRPTYKRIAYVLARIVESRGCNCSALVAFIDQMHRFIAVSDHFGRQILD